MENLTALLRERTRRMEAERSSKSLDQRVAERAYFLWENAGRPQGCSELFREQAVKLEKVGEPPAPDIAAILVVIKRRNEQSRERECDPANSWHLDLRGAVLKKADLS